MRFVDSAYWRFETVSALAIKTPQPLSLCMLPIAMHMAASDCRSFSSADQLDGEVELPAACVYAREPISLHAPHVAHAMSSQRGTIAAPLQGSEHGERNHMPPVADAVCSFVSRSGMAVYQNAS